MPTASQAIANWSTQVTARHLSDTDIALTRRALVDTVAVAFAGREETASRLARQYAIAEDSRKDCVIWATGDLVSDELAALVNGTMSHVLDFDDVSSPSRGHPSVVLWPAVFAVAERNRNTEIEAQTAFAVGLEIVAKLGRLLAIPHVAKGWHSTPTLGVLGAAVACSWLLRLNATKTSNAIGIAFAQAAGTRANFGTMSKSLQAGIGASAAVRAAKLASLGFDAGTAALDGPAGFSQVYGDNEPFDALVSELGSPFETCRSGIDIKRYPLCYATHRAIEAVLKLRREHRLSLADVKRVEVIASNKASLALIHERPTTSLEAKFSMQYAMATALHDGFVKLESFSDAMVNRPQVQTFLSSVSSLQDDGDVLPRWARVRLSLRIGTNLEETVRDLPGSAEHALTEEQLYEKFRGCLTFVGEGERAKSLFARARFPEGRDGIIRLAELLSSGSTRA